MFKPQFIYLIALISIIYSGCKNKDPKTGQVIHDTIYISKEPDGKALSDNKLTGTTVLTASSKNLETRLEHGLGLDDLESSECLPQKSESPSPTEITSIKKGGDSMLLITASINENCAYSFLGEIEITEGNTLNLIYHGYGGFAACNCCFGLTYKIEVFKKEGYLYDKIKYVTINGMAKTGLVL